MSNWLFPSLVALTAWGLWAFLPKLASNYLNAKNILIYELVGAVTVGIVGLWLMGTRVQFDPRGSALAVLAGAIGTVGTLFYLIATTKGRISLVVTLTALYPLVTILLSYFILKEPISTKQAIGMIFAIVAILFIAA